VVRHEVPLKRLRTTPSLPRTNRQLHKAQQAAHMPTVLHAYARSCNIVSGTFTRFWSPAPPAGCRQFSQQTQRLLVTVRPCPCVG
jgi:hypothetical protein